MPYADPDEKRRKQAEYRAAHRAELAARQREYFAAHRKEGAARSKAYRESHPRQRRAIAFANRANERAKKFGINGRVYARDLLKAFDLPCLYCGNDADTWDHIIPLSRGGANALSNLARCCHPCNRKKYTRTPAEWHPEWPSSLWENGHIEQVLRFTGTAKDVAA